MPNELLSSLVCRRSTKRTRSKTRRHNPYLEALERRELLTTLAWAAYPNLPAARGDALALSTYPGLLVVGGSTSAANTPTNTYLLDTSVPAWSSVAQIDRGRSAGGIGYGGNIFLYGGFDQGTPTATASYYFTNGNDTTNPPSMSIPRAAFAYATDAANFDHYAIGGLTTGNVPVASAERYDPAANAWSAIAPLPQALYGVSAAPDGFGHIFVFGGSHTYNGAPLNVAYRYTIATNSWDAISALPLGLRDAAVVDAPDGMIYIVGGRTTSGATASVEAYNPAQDAYTAAAQLPQALSGTAAAIDYDGNLTLAGGFNTAGTAVSNVYSLPIFPGLVTPYTPALTVDQGWYYYDGQPHASTASAIGIDGVTPVDGSFSFTYNGSADLPTNAGDYTVLAAFTPTDPSYLPAFATGDLYIAQATPALTVTGGGTFTYDGNPHAISASETGIDGVTPVAGTIIYTYNGTTTPPTNAGTYTAVATFTSSDPNYTDASASTTITIPNPTIPTNVKVTGTGLYSLRLSWSPPILPVDHYIIYERHVSHSPKGSGSTTTWPAVATTTGTTVDFSVTYFSSHAYEVASVSASGAVSPVSAIASGQSGYAPSLYNVLTSGGAVVSSESVEVGQTLTFTLLGYGNPAPAYTLDSGPAGMTVDPATGLVTYTPSAGDIGTQHATFTATNTFTVPLTVNSSTLTLPIQVLGLPTIALDGGPFPYDGLAHPATATAYASDGVAPLAGSFTFTYDGFSQLPVAPGTYTVVASFTSGDPGYGPAAATGVYTIAPTGVIPSPGAKFHSLLYADGSVTLIIDSGNLDFSSNLGDTGVYSIIVASGASATFYSSVALASLTLDAGATATVADTGILKALSVQSISIDPTATLDLTNNDLVVDYSAQSSSPAAGIESLIALGYSGGNWLGTGITSSEAAVNPGLYSLNILDNPTSPTPFSVFDGLAIAPNSVLVKYTYVDDLLLTGNVNANDAQYFGNNYSFNAPATHAAGNLTYTGFFNANDAILFGNSYSAGLPALPTTLGEAYAPAAPALTGGMAAAAPAAGPTASTATAGIAPASASEASSAATSPSPALLLDPTAPEDSRRSDPVFLWRPSQVEANYSFTLTTPASLFSFHARPRWHQDSSTLD